MKRLLALFLCVCGLWCWAIVPASAITIVSSTYTGNGSDDRDIVMSPACQPVAVWIKRDVAAVDMDVLFSAMGTTNSGQWTGTDQARTTSIKQLNANGFRVGTASTVNSNGQTYYYAAICDNGLSDIVSSSYSGDTTDNRDIVISPVFQPELVLIVPSADSIAGHWRGAGSHSGDSASAGNNIVDQANRIQALNANGFQVGTGLNAGSTTYYYLAIKGSAAGVASGSFSGNGSDNRDITVTTFQPELLFIKGNSTTKKQGYRFTAHAGDSSFCGADAAAANIIQSFSAGAFQVGSDTCANESGVTMRWMALKSTTAPVTGRNRSLGGLP